VIWEFLVLSKTTTCLSDWYAPKGTRAYVIKLYVRYKFRTNAAIIQRSLSKCECYQDGNHTAEILIISENIKKATQ
jgi:hypothetical protein